MKLLKYILIVSVLGSCLSSCVSLPRKTGDLNSPLSVDKLSRVLLDTAKKCWTREGTFFHDAIVVDNRLAIRAVDSRLEIRSAVITAFRRGYGIPDQPDFIIVRVDEAPGGGAHVDVEEGEYAIGVNLHLTDDVNRWVSGDLTCRKL